MSAQSPSLESEQFLGTSLFDTRVWLRPYGSTNHGRLSGGEALVKSLVKEGVEVVFGIPGIQIYGIVAALRDEPGIRMITTRHEQATT